MTAPSPEQGREEQERVVNPDRLFGLMAGASPEEMDARLARAVLDALDLPALLAEAEKRGRVAGLREAADGLQAATEGVTREGTATWSLQDRDVYSLAIEEAQTWLRARANQEETR